MGAARARSGTVLLLFCLGVIASAASWFLVTVPAIVVLSLVLVVLLVFPATRVWAALAAGMLWFSANAMWLDAGAWPAERAGETVGLTGRVVGLPDQHDGRARIEIRPDAGALQAGVPGRVLLSWYRPLEWFRPGERWRLTARLEPLDGRANPGRFDYHRYLVARGIGALGRVESAERLDSGGWSGRADRFRQRFAHWLQAETVDLDAAALHRALTVADRSAMAPELAERLRRTGTAHLLSISGLHVGMVAGLAGLLAGLFATPLVALGVFPDRKRTMLAAGLAAAFGYAMLAGFTLPTVRALVMLGAGFGAMLWRRAIQPGRALLTALAAVLVVDPLAPLSVGFWLSFGAVAVLIWAFSGRARGAGPVRGLTRAQVVVVIGLLPLNIGIFGQWAPTALAINLLAIPLVGLWVLPCLLAALGLFALGLPAAFMVAASEQGLRLFLALLDAFAGLDALVADWSMPAGPAPGLTAIAVAGVGALWLLAPRGWPLRALGAVLLLPLLWPARWVPAAGEFEVVIPDLGDGQAVVVRTRGRTLLYGTGPGDGDRRSLVPGTIAPLVRQGVHGGGSRAVDRIVVPYAHTGYAGGLAEARRQWPQARVLQPVGADAKRCTAGRAWTVDGVRFRFVHPSPGLPDLGADSSCVLEVRSRHGSVLLTGGMGAAVARRLVLEDAVEPVDWLVLPRFGHRDGIDRAWLERLAPEIAVATVERFNRRGLPHEATRAALDRVGARLLTTGRCGALRVRFIADGRTRIRAERVARKRYWHRPVDCAPE